MELTFLSITIIFCSVVGIIGYLIEQAILKKTRRKAELQRHLMNAKKQLNRQKTFSECLLPIED